MGFFHPAYFCVRSVTNLITNNILSFYILAQHTRSDLELTDQHFLSCYSMVQYIQTDLDLTDQHYLSFHILVQYIYTDLDLTNYPPCYLPLIYLVQRIYTVWDLTHIPQWKYYDKAESISSILFNCSTWHFILTSHIWSVWVYICLSIRAFLSKNRDFNFLLHDAARPQCYTTFFWNIIYYHNLHLCFKESCLTQEGTASFKN